MLEVSYSRPAKKIASVTPSYQIPSSSLITLYLFSTLSTLTATLLRRLNEGWCFRRKVCTSDFPENRFKHLIKLVWYSWFSPFTWELAVCLLPFFAVHFTLCRKRGFCLKINYSCPTKMRGRNWYENASIEWDKVLFILSSLWRFVWIGR